MANAHRGEIEAVFNSRTYRLRLTLGALADLEQLFGAQDLVALAQRFESGRLSARDILNIIACGLRGGGNDMPPDEIDRLAHEDGLQGFAHVAAELLAATFGAAESGGHTANFPPVPQDTTD